MKKKVFIKTRFLWKKLENKKNLSAKSNRIHKVILILYTSNPRQIAIPSARASEFGRPTRPADASVQFNYYLIIKLSDAMVSIVFFFTYQKLSDLFFILLIYVILYIPYVSINYHKHLRYVQKVVYKVSRVVGFVRSWEVREQIVSGARVSRGFKGHKKLKVVSQELKGFTFFFFTIMRILTFCI